MHEDAVRDLERAMFPLSPDRAGYVLLDGAQIPDVANELADRATRYDCLYLGSLDPELAAVAPYLVELRSGDDVFEWVTEEGWGKNWGVFLVAEGDFPVVRQQLRKCTYAILPDGKKVYFRYYDPRVMRSFMPDTDAEQKKLLFGSVIKQYWVEDEEGTGLTAFLADGEELAMAAE